jgi:predicted CoA-binding protein
MTSKHAEFWNHASYAVVGDSAKKGFPRLSYGELKKRGKRVFAVDPALAEIEGDRTYSSLAALPERVDAVVLEVPREDTLDLVRQAADAGIGNVWIHMTRDTPEAVAFARERGLNVLTGACAVMYLAKGLSAHTVHRWASRLAGRY